MAKDEWKVVVRQDVADATTFYGGVLDVRRTALKLRGRKLPVARVRLVYDAKLRPDVTQKDLKEFLETLEGVEVLFE
jgi:hypothetical protein